MPDVDRVEARREPPNLWLVRAWKTLLAWSRAADGEHVSSHSEQWRRSLNVTTTDVATGVYWGGRSQRVYEPEARVLFVVRESSLSAIHQLASMAATVLGGHSHRDDLHDLINGGASPLALDTLYLGELTRRKHAHRIET